jgi:hypothetical protein
MYAGDVRELPVRGHAQYTPPRTLTGFLAESDRPGFRRLYLTADRDYHAEFRAESIVDVEVVPAAEAPFLGFEAVRVTLEGEGPDYTRTPSSQPDDEFDLDVESASKPAARDETWINTDSCLDGCDTGDTCRNTCDPNDPNTCLTCHGETCGGRTCEPGCTDTCEDCPTDGCTQAGETCDEAGTCAHAATCDEAATCAATCDEGATCEGNTCDGADTCTCQTDCQQDTCNDTCNDTCGCPPVVDHGTEAGATCHTPTECVPSQCKIPA